MGIRLVATADLARMAMVNHLPADTVHHLGMVTDRIRPARVMDHRQVLADMGLLRGTEAMIIGTTEAHRLLMGTRTGLRLQVMDHRPPTIQAPTMTTGRSAASLTKGEGEKEVGASSGPTRDEKIWS